MFACSLEIQISFVLVGELAVCFCCGDEGIHKQTFLTIPYQAQKYILYHLIHLNCMCYVQIGGQVHGKQNKPCFIVNDYVGKLWSVV